MECPVEMTFQDISFGSFSADEISDLFTQETKDLQFVWQSNDRFIGADSRLAGSTFLEIPSILDQKRRSYSPEIHSPHLPPNPPTSPVEYLSGNGLGDKKDFQLSATRPLNVNAIPFVPGAPSSAPSPGKNHPSTSSSASPASKTTTAVRKLDFDLSGGGVVAGRDMEVALMISELKQMEEEDCRGSTQSLPVLIQTSGQPTSESKTTNVDRTQAETAVSGDLPLTSTSTLRDRDHQPIGAGGAPLTLTTPTLTVASPTCVCTIDNHQPLVSSNLADSSPAAAGTMDPSFVDSNGTTSNTQMSQIHDQAPPHTLTSSVTSSPSPHSSQNMGAESVPTPPPEGINFPSPTSAVSSDNDHQRHRNGAPFPSPPAINGTSSMSSMNSKSPSGQGSPHRVGVATNSGDPCSSNTSVSSDTTPTTISSATPTVGGAWGTNRIKSWASIFSQSSSDSSNSQISSTSRTQSAASCSRTSNQKLPQDSRPKEVGGGGIGEGGPSEAPIGKSQKEDTTPSSRKGKDFDVQFRSLGQQLLNWQVSYKSKSIQPRGLLNQGNWCYMHAPLQALLSIPCVIGLFKALNPNPPLCKGPSLTPFVDTMIQFVHEFRDYPKTGLTAPPSGSASGASSSRKKRLSHLAELLPGEPFRPDYVYTMLHKIRSNLSYKGRQEDAEEFLGCMLDGLHEEIVSAKKAMEESNSEDKGSSSCEREGVVVGSPQEGQQQLPPEEQKKQDEAGEEEWEQVGPKNKSTITRQISFSESPITEIFGGQLRSALHRHGAKESATMEPFFSLQLDIQSDSITSVKEALEALAAKETVHMSEVDAYKHLTLGRLPPVLIFHLKRFVFTSYGSQKLFKHIHYTPEMEITKELLAPTIKSKLPAAQRSYRLWAVVYHHGKMATGGHYTCDVYNSGYGGWIRIDDSLIKPIPDEFVLKPGGGVVNKNAYLLFYRRLDTVKD